MELLQNADDAGASRVCLMLDAAHHPTNSVLGPEMAIWQVCLYTHTYTPITYSLWPFVPICEVVCPRVHRAASATRVTAALAPLLLATPGPSAGGLQRRCVQPGRLLRHRPHRPRRQAVPRFEHRPLWPGIQCGAMCDCMFWGVGFNLVRCGIQCGAMCACVFGV